MRRWFFQLFVAAASSGACIALVLPAARGEGSLNNVGDSAVAGRLASGREGPGISLEDRFELLERDYAAAVAEKEEFARQVDALRLRLEALGCVGNGTTQSLVEGRLLKAVSDLRQSEQSRKSLLLILKGIYDALIVQVDSLSRQDQEAAFVMENQLRLAGNALGYSSRTGSALTKDRSLGRATVLALEKNLGVVVVGFGCESNVRVGAPLVFERGSTVVGLGRAVDVRPSVSAVVVERVFNEKSWLALEDVVRADVRR
jgi:hypothetical protein